MCGICCRIRRLKQNENVELQVNGFTESQIDPLTHELLHNRGPNAHSQLKLQANDFEILFSGFVLWQQGDVLCQQPCILKHHVLLINGDIFTKRECTTTSDTEWLIQSIDDCDDNEDRLLELFRNIQGPYSVLYFNRNTQELYFIRDVLGRQSLLVAENIDGSLTFGSVLGSPKDQYKKCIELPPLGVFCFSLSTQTVHLSPWQRLDQTNIDQLQEIEELLKKSIEIRESLDSLWLSKPAIQNEFNLEELLHEFANKKSSEIFDHLLNHESVLHVCDELLIHLQNSLIDRINSTPPYCRKCMIAKDKNCGHSRVGILFSGGIDCTILAVLTDKLLDPSQPIDLINVSFEKVRSTGPPIDYNTPDRISARDSLIELRRLNPKRKWKLIEVNVTRTELNEALKKRIAHLVYPLNSVLDESLGSVLWFGARGCGKVDDIDYDSNCRILLIGSGADELFGGYTRHRNAFIRSNPLELTPYERLENELEFDFKRLPSRNLARDDRIIGDFGVTARSPYLEERFVRFVRSLKAFQKCYHSLEQGVGDKLLLRLSGYHLGLREATSLKKRAMQFGSRVADAKQNAKDISKSLTQ